LVDDGSGLVVVTATERSRVVLMAKKTAKKTTKTTKPVAKKAGARPRARAGLKRMDNVGIVVESLGAAISFFAELGLELEGEPPSKVSGQVASRDCATSASRPP
jgi:hypothetical protein